MDHGTQIVTLQRSRWREPEATEAAVDAIAAVEAGKVLYLPRLGFALSGAEQDLLRPALLAEGSRNISLNAEGKLKGAAGTEAERATLARMIGRFREDAQALIHSLLPAYTPHLRLAPTSFRPARVETREQSWRADDRRLHVDAFPSRPNYGERILRVFANVNPAGEPRMWRVGEPFEDIARRFVPRAKPYSALQARLLRGLRITKSLRSEYDHLMLQLHDGMKRDERYQKESAQVSMPFAAGSVWVCFSDQASHAVMAGQYMLEQTLHLPPDRQYNPQSSPLALLTRLAGHRLVP